MSFGFAVGDFLAVSQLCWNVYKRCKDSPGNYAQLSSEVGSLNNVLKETEELLSQQSLTPERKAKLTESQRGCEDVLKELNGILTKYERMGTNARRTFDRMGFGMQNMTSIRLRLISNVTMLDAFNNTSSNARLENKLNLLIAEVRSGRREGSVISTETFDTAARNDRQTWEALRKELEDIGISPSVITEKRQFIIEWFQEAVAAGKLDEDAPSDDISSNICLYEPDDAEIESDSDLVPTMEMSSLTIKPPTMEEAVTRESVPSGQRLSRQPADSLHAPSLRENSNSRSRVTSLMNKLRGKDRQFLTAAKVGDVSEIEKLLRKGVDIQALDQSDGGATALHIAAGGGKEKAVRLLLDHKADVEAKDETGRTALFSAANGGHTSIVQLMVEKGADLEVKDNDFGITGLMWAASEGHTSIVQLMLEKGANLEAKDNGFGVTALMWAAAAGHTSIVQLMLEKGANLEAKDNKFGMTALMYATRGGHTSILRLMLQEGANIEAQSLSGMTMLMWAANGGHISIMQLTLGKGASLEVKGLTGMTALMWAALRGHTSVLQLMLEKGADLEAKEDEYGMTALMWATSRNHIPTVQLLLEKGADLEAKSSSGRTAFIWAAALGHTFIVQLMLEKGARVEAQTSSGTTALMWAASRSHASTVQFLLEKGANPEAKTLSGRTALAFGKAGGSKEVVKLLREWSE